MRYRCSFHSRCSAKVLLLLRKRASSPLARTTRPALTYEIPLALQRDVRDTALRDPATGQCGGNLGGGPPVLPNGTLAEGDCEETGFGDMNLRFLYKLGRGLGGDWLVGSQFNLVEFLDKNRRGASSTFLTRLRLGEKIVDAKGVSRLYRPAPGVAPTAIVLAVGVAALLAIILVTPGLRDVADLLWLKLRVLLGGGI